MIITTTPSDTTSNTSSFTKNSEDTKRLEMKLGRTVPLLTCPCPCPHHGKVDIDSNKISDSLGSEEVNYNSNSNNHVGVKISNNNSINTSSSNSSLSSHSSNAISCGSSTTIDNGTSSTNHTKKRVSFSSQQTAYFSPDHQLTKQDLKTLCWYSEAELTISRDEARMAIHALHHQLQLDADAAAASVGKREGRSSKNKTTSATRSPSKSSLTAAAVDDASDCSSSSSTEKNSWELRCPHDRSKIMCLRGIEKYADAAAKYAGQKRLVHSVLQQQALMNNTNTTMNNNKDVHIAMVSRTLSEPFKEVARYYAMKSADELDSFRKVEKKQQQQETERKQREEVATVLLLIMGQQQQQQQLQTQDDEGFASLSPVTAVATTNLMMPLSPRQSMLSESGSVTSSQLKRSSSTTDYPLSERNVRPCSKTISDRRK